MALAPRRRQSLRVPYLSEDFPPGSAPNASGDLFVSWDEVLWAAITLGRPNLHSVFEHGEASYHEAIFRISAVRLALEQRSHRGSRFWRTDAFKRLDPTEKGAITYLLGMTFCKVFAARMLNTPWLLHLDVFRDQIGALLTERSRPDLIGQHAITSAWHAFECKGRSSAPSLDDRTKAKLQAQRIASVGGSPCALHVAAFTFARSDKLEFSWRDPPAEGKPLEIADTDGAWRWHYQPVTELVRHNGAGAEGATGATFINGLDLSVAIHPLIAEALAKGDWARAHAQARQLGEELKASGYEPDGIAIRTGDSWTARFRPGEAPLSREG